MGTDPKKIVSFKDLYAVQRAREEPPADVEPNGEEGISQPQQSQLQQSQLPDSRLREPGLAGSRSRLSESQPQQSQPQQSQPPRSQPQQSQLNLLTALPDVNGHTELPHQLVDHLYPHLDPFEQAVYTQLYRLSWGYKSNRCRISNERLAGRAGMSVAKLKRTAGQLESKGLIRKIDRPHGRDVVQGIEYEINAPSWQLRRSRLPDSQLPDSRLQETPNKDKELKENEKGLVDCPDCFGTGMWYPEGYEKGVARCRHARRKKE